MSHLSGLGTLARTYRLVIFAIVGLVTVIAGVGLTKIKFDRDPRVYFGEETADRVLFDTFEERYGRITSAVAVLKDKDDADLDVDALKALRELAKRFEKVEGVAKTTSIVSLPILATTGPDRKPRPVALTDIENPSDEDVEKLLQEIRKDPSKFSSLVSEDLSTALVSVTMQLPGTEKDKFNAAVDEIKDIKSDVAETFDSKDILLTGDGLLPSNFDAAFKSDLKTLMPLQFGAMILFLFICYRSIGATVATLVLLVVSIVITMGVAGWAGLVLNGVSAGTISVLNGLAVATCVHIVFAWQDGCRAGDPSLLALGKSLRSNFKPVVLALITTVASFLSLNYSDSPPFRHLGSLVALGLVLVLIFSFTFLPAMLSLMNGPKPREKEATSDALLKRLSGWVISNYVALNALAVVIFAVSIFGLGQIVFDDRFSKYFDSRFEFRQATDVYEDKFSGIGSIHYSIAEIGEAKLGSPEYLRAIADFTDWLEDQKEVNSVSSVLNLYKSVSLSAPNTADDRGVPKDQASADQLEKLIEQQVSQADRNLTYAEGEKATKLTVFFGKVSSREILDFKERADEKFRDISSEIATEATGMSILAGLLSSRNIDGMIVGTLISLVLVSAVMVFALGNVSLGIVSLLPNIMPMLIAYGLWGFFVGEVSFAGAMVCAMTFGIVVDDTVHFMNKYRFLRTVRLLSPTDAMAECFRTVGSAIVVTTFAIGIGFMALGMSGFLVNHHLGTLTAMTLMSALVADLLFLPALLYLMERGTEAEKAGKDPNSQRIGDTRIQLPETGAAFLVDVDRPNIILPLGTGKARVGRHPENDVVLGDPTVHRYHAVMEPGLGKGFHIEDLSPAHGNGVWVNGKRAREADVVPGDLIELGEVRLRYVSA